MVADPELSDTRVTLTSGDLLLLFTDGVTEARTNGDLYGDERLEVVMTAAEPTAGGVVAAVLDDVLRYQQGQARDDIALVALGVPA